MSHVPALLALSGGALSWSLQHSLVRASIPVAVVASPLSSSWQEPRWSPPERDYSDPPPPFGGRETGAVGTAKEIVPSRAPHAGDPGVGLCLRQSDWLTPRSRLSSRLRPRFTSEDSVWSACECLLPSRAKLVFHHLLFSHKEPKKPAGVHALQASELVVTYFFCGEEIPYRRMLKAQSLTLGHFKEQLSKKGNYRYEPCGFFLLQSSFAQNPEPESSLAWPDLGVVKRKGARDGLRAAVGVGCPDAPSLLISSLITTNK